MAHSMVFQMPCSVGGAHNRSSALDRAATLYARALERGQHGGFYLNACPRCLLTLDEVETDDDVCAWPREGTQVVPIAQIRGSEGRSGDFDREFNPLQDRSRERWLSVAVARQQGKALPPVELIQIGEVYFVRDGHHRISVARALGQQTIEARVLVWQVTGPLPWEAPDTGQGKSVGRRLDKVRAGAARFRKHASNAVEAGLKIAAAFVAAAVGG